MDQPTPAVSGACRAMSWLSFPMCELALAAARASEIRPTSTSRDQLSPQTHGASQGIKLLLKIIKNT